MPTPRNACLLCAMIGASVVAAIVPAVGLGQSSALPSKIVRIIVPNEAAGPNDLTGRVIAPRLQEVLGQNVVVENRASANGVVGSQYVAQATPDGSVLAVGTSGTHAVNATLYKNPTYDPVKDFAPISEVIFAPLLLVTNHSLKANKVKELISEARTAPGKINFAVAGATGEIAGNLIKMLGKVEINN